MNASIAVLEALAVTAELTGTQLSAAAARVMADDLARYPADQVLGALSRCRKELRGRMVVADIVSRLDDGRPGPEEAWSMLPMDEAQTCVWTEEMSGAWGVAAPLIAEGDRIAARMAFIETYRTRVLRARDTGTPVRWTVSFGRDATARQGALDEAVRLGRLTHSFALQLGYKPVLDTSALPKLDAIAEGLARRLTKKGGE